LLLVILMRTSVWRTSSFGLLRDWCPPRRKRLRPLQHVLHWSGEPQQATQI